MKTFVVRTPDLRHWMGNAESPEEAVDYAIARASLYAARYIVYDWDANCFEVETPQHGA